MDNGMNSIQNDGVLVKEKAKKRNGCFLLTSTIGILIVLFGIYLFCVLRNQWTPVVEGIIVDTETGLPLEGVAIVRQGWGSHFLGEHPQGESSPGYTTTGKDGLFYIPGTFRDYYGDFTPFYLLPTRGIKATRLSVYCQNCVGADCLIKLDNLEVQQKGHSAVLKVKRGTFKNMELIIKLKKATDEGDWIEKCHLTYYQKLQYYHKSPDLIKWNIPADEWLYNDIRTYLERFPDGEKSGEYYRRAWELTNLISCNYTINALQKEEITLEQVKTQLERKRVLISLAKSFKRPPCGYNRVDFERDLDYEEKQFMCVKAVLR